MITAQIIKYWIFTLDGGWTSWSSWTSCNVTCGGGVKSRSRSCTNPKPSNGGAVCSGSTTQNLQCNGQLCPICKSLSFSFSFLKLLIKLKIKEWIISSMAAIQSDSCNKINWSTTVTIKLLLYC